MNPLAEIEMELELEIEVGPHEVNGRGDQRRTDAMQYNATRAELERRRDTSLDGARRWEDGSLTIDLGSLNHC